MTRGHPSRREGCGRHARGKPRTKRVGAALRIAARHSAAAGGEGGGGRGKSEQGLLLKSKKRGEEASWKAFSQLFAVLASSGEWNARGAHVHVNAHEQQRGIQRDIQTELGRHPEGFGR